MRSMPKSVQPNGSIITKGRRHLGALRLKVGHETVYLLAKTPVDDLDCDVLRNLPVCLQRLNSPLELGGVLRTVLDEEHANIAVREVPDVVRGNVEGDKRGSDVARTVRTATGEAVDIDDSRHRLPELPEPQAEVGTVNDQLR